MSGSCAEFDIHSISERVGERRKIRGRKKEQWEKEEKRMERRKRDREKKAKK